QIRPAQVAAGEALLETARRALPGRLPRHMVPSLWAHLPALPHTPNGKVDYRALPLPDASGNAAGEAAYAPPRNPVEERLAAIWAEVLKIPRAGIHDNFFDLGGHSLLATQLVVHIHERFGVDIPLSRIFDTADLAALAHEILQKESDELEAKVEGLSGDELEALLAEIREEEA
ncbi:MAG TPA: phosphopantetheine-binding protein, partial [Thermoanaerobaculia bacterium]|nr:phosphopantetheine-binding protein [Thermoanaerobaculia bacterium]